MGAYDDLIPSQKEQPAEGAYGDLVPQESSLGEQATRAVGLSARQVGPRAAAAAAGAAMGAPIAGVGAVPGAIAGLSAFELVNLLDKVAGTNFLEKALDALGLPKPESDVEKLVEGTTEAMGGMGGMVAGAKTALQTAKGPMVRGLAEDLTKAPIMGQVSAGAAGAAGEASRQSGGDPVDQLLASGGAAAVAPLGVATGQSLLRAGKNTIQDIIAAIRASGSNPNPAAVRRLESQAIDTLAKGQEAEIADALKSTTKYMPGARPNVAEALTEYNMKHPYKQIGGALIKMQDQLYGARGIEDVLPSAAARVESNVKHYIARLDVSTGKLRDQAFNDIKMLGGKPAGIPALQDARMLAAHPEFAGHPAVRATMKDVMKELQMGMDKEGYIDPHRLYSIRQTLNETMTKEAAKAGMSPNHEVARKALKLVKTNIDNAMVAAGAPGWKEYLQMFSNGMAKVEAHETRAAAAAKVASRTAVTTPGELVRGELPHIPTLLHRGAMFTSFILRLVSEGATEPVARQLALDMTDPAKFRALLLRPKGQPIRVEMNKVLMQAAILSSLVKKHQVDNPQGPPPESE